MSDERIALMAKGNMTAFTSLFDEYLPRLYGFCHKYLHNAADAQEVAQETFIRIWESRETIDPRQNFGTYLIAIAKYRIYNIIKHRFVEEKHRANVAEAIRPRFSQEDELLWNDLVELMLSSIENLPPRQRVVLLLRSQGYTNAEIAERLEISIRSVETYYSKALINMRTILGPECQWAVLLFLAPFF